MKPDKEGLETKFTWNISDFKKTLKSKSPVLISEHFLMSQDASMEWCIVLSVMTAKKAFFSSSANFSSNHTCSTCLQSLSRLKNCNCFHESNSSDDIVAVVLENQNCQASDNPVSLNIMFSILDAKESKVFTRTKIFEGVLTKNHKYGFENFITARELETLLVNCNLAISCEIRVTGNGYIDEEVCLFKGFNSYINSQSYSDVILCLGDEKIPAHKVILASKSPVFDKMFSTDMVEAKSNVAKVNNITLDVFQELLRFMYTGKVEKIDKLAVDIFKAAHFYQIEHLKLLCENALRKTLTVENAVDFLKLADDHDADCLKDHCFVFIMTHLKTIMKSPSFQDLHESHPHLPLTLLMEMGSKYDKDLK